MKRELPTIEYLQEILDYDPETGIISWKVDKGRCKKGRKVATKKHRGYLIICIEGRELRVHRVAFVLVTGAWPEFFVDHINGNKADNRFSNLRQATVAQNSQNSKLSKKNVSGFKGVSWNKAAKKWVAYICANRKLHHLGLFENIEDAVITYKRAAETLHKDFASHKGCMQNVY